MIRNKSSIYEWNQLLNMNLYARHLYSDDSIVFIGYTTQSASMRSAQHELDYKHGLRQKNWIIMSQKFVLRINGKVGPDHPMNSPWQLTTYETAVIVSHEIKEKGGMEKIGGPLGNTKYPISQIRIEKLNDSFDPFRIYNL